MCRKSSATDPYHITYMKDTDISLTRLQPQLKKELSLIMS